MPGRKPVAKIGQTYNGVKIVAYVAPSKAGSLFSCQCTCGALFTWAGSQIVRGIKKHCGCKSPFAQFRGLPKTRSRGSITIAQLRAEGVLEVGGIDDTAILFVRTEHGVHLFHRNEISDRLMRADQTINVLHSGSSERHLPRREQTILERESVDVGRVECVPSVNC